MALGSNATDYNSYGNVSVQLEGLTANKGVKLVVGEKNSDGNFITTKILVGEDCKISGKFNGVVIRRVNNYHNGKPATFVNIKLTDDSEKKNYWLKLRVGTQVSKVVVSLLSSVNSLGEVNFAFSNNKKGFVNTIIRNDDKLLRPSMRRSKFNSLTERSIVSEFENLTK